MRSTFYETWFRTQIWHSSWPHDWCDPLFRLAFRVSVSQIHFWWSQNRLRKKIKLATSSTAHRFELDLEARRTHFRHSKTQIQSRKNSNRGPQKDPPILLRTCLIELLRHSFSASRSQSSACGAIKTSIHFAVILETRISSCITPIMLY